MTDTDKFLGGAFAQDGVTLIIGDLIRWQSAGRGLPDIDGIHFADAEEIDAALLARLKPVVILSPLMTRTFDAIDIARMLCDLGFAGRYRVLSEGLPDLALVQREIAFVAPTIDFAVVSLPTATDDA